MYRCYYRFITLLSADHTSNVSSFLLDIPSVLADSTVFNPDDGTGGGGFVVHWLNNKDLSFTSSMDLFMLQLRKFSEQQLEHTSEDPLDVEGSPLKFDFGMCQRREILLLKRHRVHIGALWLSRAGRDV